MNVRWRGLVVVVVVAGILLGLGFVVAVVLVGEAVLVKG